VARLSMQEGGEPTEELKPLIPLYEDDSDALAAQKSKAQSSKQGGISSSMREKLLKENQVPALVQITKSVAGAFSREKAPASLQSTSRRFSRLVGHTYPRFLYEHMQLHSLLLRRYADTQKCARRFLAETLTLRETPPSPSLPLAGSLRCRCSVGVENLPFPQPRDVSRLQAASQTG